jgi:hypothetical protein
VTILTTREMPICGILYVAAAHKYGERMKKPEPSLELTPAGIPVSLRPFFQEYLLEDLDPEHSAFTVIERTLAWGDRRELQWLHLWVAAPGGVDPPVRLAPPAATAATLLALFLRSDRLSAWRADMAALVYRQVSGFAALRDASPDRTGRFQCY